MELLSLLKSKLLVLGAGLIAFLLAALKFMSASRARAVKRADRAEAELEFRDDVDEMETELSSNYQPHRADIVNAEDDETFDVLSDSDSVRMRK